MLRVLSLHLSFPRKSTSFCIRTTKSFSYKNNNHPYNNANTNTIVAKQTRLQYSYTNIRRSYIHIPCMKRLNMMLNPYNEDDNDIIKIYNPLSKRYIQQTTIYNNYNNTNNGISTYQRQKRKKNKWNEFMFDNGGYIAYCGELIPIDLESLSLWNEKMESGFDETQAQTQVEVKKQNNETTHELKLKDDETWHLAKIQTLESYNQKNHIKDTISCDDDTDSNEEIQYPILEQLLFVSKPSKMLTLPGIDESKSDCLASHVNQYLSEDPNGVGLMQRCNEITAKTKVNHNHNHHPQTQPSTKRKRKEKKKQLFIPRPCHRLDYDTSGIIAFGLCIDSLRDTSKLFELRKVNKTYVALVAGHLDADNGIIEYPIGKIPTDKGYNKFACLIQNNKESSRSKFLENSIRPAKTYFIVSKRFSIPDPKTGRIAKYTRVELEPYTGRGHQLRLHMEAIGHPILGDSLHGNVMVTPRLCLHSMNLSLVVRCGCGDETETEYRKIAVSSLPPF